MFEAIEQTAVSFTPAQLELMNAAQALLVLVVGLHLELGELRRVREFPKAVAATLAAQWLVAPALALALVALLRAPPAPALALLLIAACPGGSAAAFLALFARGNAAVAVAAATLSTLATALATPLVFGICAALAGLGGEGALHIAPAQVLRTVLLFLLLPLAAGLALRHWRPRLARRVGGPLKLLLGLLLGAFVVGAVHRNLTALRTLAPALTPPVFLLLGALALGAYGLALACRLEAADRRALTLAVLVTNSGLGLLLVFRFFGGAGAMAALLAWWSVWRLAAAGALALAWSRPWRASAG